MVIENWRLWQKKKNSSDVENGWTVMGYWKAAQRKGKQCLPFTTVFLMDHLHRATSTTIYSPYGLY